MIHRRIINYLFTKIFHLLYKKRFKYLGENSRIIFPLDIQGMRNIHIGDGVTIGYKTWLACTANNPARQSHLIIGEGTCVGNFNHIYCTSHIEIGKKVLTADKVYISDNLHSYEDVNIPIIDQPVKQINPVHIGDGSWIGEHVCIIGASIGKNCVIGANSVVTKNIPDYSVAVGIPARVIKMYNFEKRVWESSGKVSD